ncbi:MAG TPA: FAD-dependent oxidoreductase [Aggregatilineales bacterium]|nr:FAD-dependent oxidoreductase [Aggregatilineales bacterium]
MTSSIGTSTQPLRVAIVGSGPAGFYAADHLEKQPDLTVHIDMFDRLPTPFGLVRGGVAPDHPKIKSVTRAYDKMASDDRFHFYGNVEFGRDLTYEDLLRHYHAIIFCVGAQSDRHMNVPGEDLPGSHPATEFVAWYNSHPDFRDFNFDLSAESVAVIGLGNVAMDVIRILAKTPEELIATDIADHALEALRESRVKTIHVLGRRGPAQSAFTNPEIKELGELLDAEVIVAPEDLELDPISAALVESDKTVAKNVETLRGYAAAGPQGKRRQVIMHFCVSPTGLLGDDHVEGITIVKNRLVDDGKGSVKAVPTGEVRNLPVQLVFRSVGYYGRPLPGLPFDDKRGVLPNDKGRILTAEAPLQGSYCAGWIKRGPSGVIGTNKPDSVETVDSLLADLQAGALNTPAEPDSSAVEARLAARGVRVVTWADWQQLDRLEQERGKERGAPRLKFSSVAEMLAALDSLAEGHPTS